MSSLTRQERVDLFRSLFRGREDVFAMRWQKFGTDLSGYSPVFANRERTAYRALTQREIENHLLGHITLGIYPLLQNHASHFVAADFDKKNWRGDSKALYDVCRKYDLPVGLEISRSGNGAHVWCFFEKPYPASQSRKLFLALLRRAECLGDYDRDESFDRLFPNQDMHSGKGLGNLIALPLQGKSRKEGKTVFVDPETWLPYADQWDFLSCLKKIQEQRLDELYKTLHPGSPTFPNQRESLIFDARGPLRIEVSSMLKIPKQQVPPALVTYLREELNFFNSEYIAKSRIGFATHGIEKFFKTVFTDDHFVYIPRGYLSSLIVFLQEKAIAFEIADRRLILEDVELNKEFELYEYQKNAVASFVNKDQGILVAPPGSGKTLMGLALALAKKQPTLILTHRQNILEQWVESIHSFLGLVKKDIGRYSGATKKIKSPFTVAMLQTVARMKNKEEIFKNFGCVLVDECHHVPAKMFREVINHIPSKYLFGLTATHKRKYNDHKLITAYLGSVVHEVPGNYSHKTKGTSTIQGAPNISVFILKSSFSLPYTLIPKDFSHLQKLLSLDAGRNTIIARAIQSEISQKRKVLVLAERKEHIEALRYFLKKNIDVLVMTGTLSARQKRYRFTRIKNGTFQVVLATGQFFGEGVDVTHFDSLFLVSPHSFEGKLTQYIGRLRRGEGEKRVFDMRDPQVEILERMFRKRMAIYNKLVKSGEITHIRVADSLL